MPPTSSPKNKNWIWWGVLSAGLSIAFLVMIGGPKGCISASDWFKSKITVHETKTVASESIPFAEQAFDCSAAFPEFINIETGRSGKRNGVAVPLHGGAALLHIQGGGFNLYQGWCYEGQTRVTNGRMDEIRHGLKIRLSDPQDEEATDVVTFERLRLRCDASGKVSDCWD